MFFENCPECEGFVLFLVVALAGVVDFILRKRRKWGENHKKWREK